MTARHALPKHLPIPAAAPAPVPPLVAEIREIVLRHVADLRFRWTYDAAEAAAFRVLAAPEIADGLKAARTVAELDARHQPRPWRGSSTGFVCTCGAGAHPCPDRRVLDGELAEVPA